MKITPIIAETWKIDGGTSFGVVPKAIWGKLYPADENNLQIICSRCLVVETAGRVVLFDTGMGDKQDEKFFRYRYRTGPTNLIGQLAEAGYAPGDVTDVVFTHLHYDHCGGASHYPAVGDAPARTFPNAVYHVSEAQKEWALHPNVREAASYLPENLGPVFDNGPLNLIREEGQFLPGIRIRLFNGHTAGHIIPLIDYNGQTLAFTSDFIPSAAHIPLVYIPAFDIQPLLTLAEKEAFLGEAVRENYLLVFGHDHYNEASFAVNNGRGYIAGSSGTLAGLLNSPNA